MSDKPFPWECTCGQRKVMPDGPTLTCRNCGTEWSNPYEQSNEVIMSTKYTNMVGNPIDGFRCIGIYDDLQDAIDWQDGCDESCWVVELEEVTLNIESTHGRLYGPTTDSPSRRDP